MNFKTIDTLETIAEAIRNGDALALERVLDKLIAASNYAVNWPFDSRTLELLLVTLLKRLFDRELHRQIEFGEHRTERTFVPNHAGSR